MGAIKLARKESGQSISDCDTTQHGVDTTITGANTSNTESCMRGLIWFLSILTVSVSFGAVNFLQFNEISYLKQRLDYLENNVLVFTDDEGIVRSTRQVKRQTLQENIKATIQQELSDPKNCPVCPHRSQRDVTADQQCCSALSMPGYGGDNSVKVPVISRYFGQDVLIPCNGTGYPPPTIRFEPDPSNDPGATVTNNGLRLTNLNTNSSGLYTCVIENIFGTAKKTIELRVNDPVIATSSPTTVSAQVGKPFEIICHVSGNPTPNVTWVHVRPDGQRESVQNYAVVNGKYMYHVDSASPTDAGRYICSAQNQYESGEGTTTVAVDGMPQILTKDSYFPILEGQTITLRCDIIANPPATVKWTYPLTGNKPPLNAYVNPDNSLTLSDIDFFNNGNYTCTATNAKGSVSIHAGLLVEKPVTVSASPHTQPIDSNTRVVSLHCQASGDPEPTKSWFKDATPLTDIKNPRYIVLTGNMIITQPDVATDTGTYSCYGENRVSNETDSVIVYNDLGAVTCSITFKDKDGLGCKIGQVCGVTCPDDCVSTGQALFGSGTYSEDSPVCVAATHNNNLPNPSNNLVLWKHTGSQSVTGTTSNGITSQSSPNVDTDTAVLLTAKSYPNIQHVPAALIG